PLGWSFLRPTGGGPPVRLAEGKPLGLSPDGKWVLVNQGTPGAPKLVLTPRGAGQSRVLSTEGLQELVRAWFMDPTHVLLDAAEPDRFCHTFLLDLEGGRPVAVTPESTLAVLGTAVGGSVIGVAPDGALVRYPLGGGEPRPLGVSLPEGTAAIRASTD